MKKYQWNNANLYKKARLYDRLMLVCAVLTAVVWFFALAVPLWLLVVLVAIAVLCALRSWRIQRQDIKMKAIKKEK